MKRTTASATALPPCKLSRVDVRRSDFILVVFGAASWRGLFPPFNPGRRPSFQGASRPVADFGPSSQRAPRLCGRVGVAIAAANDEVPQVLEGPGCDRQQPRPSLPDRPERKTAIMLKSVSLRHFMRPLCRFFISTRGPSSPPVESSYSRRWDAGTHIRELCAANDPRGNAATNFARTVPGTKSNSPTGAASIRVLPTKAIGNQNSR